MIDPELPATQPIPTIDHSDAIEFLARLRDDTHRAGRTIRALPQE